VYCGFKIKELVENLILLAWVTTIKLRSFSDISSTRSLIFAQGWDISKFGLILAFKAFKFRNKATQLKSETHVWTGNDYPILWSNLAYVASTTLRIRHCNIALMKNWPVKCILAYATTLTKSISEVGSLAELEILTRIFCPPSPSFHRGKMQNLSLDFRLQSPFTCCHSVIQKLSNMCQLKCALKAQMVGCPM